MRDEGGHASGKGPRASGAMVRASDGEAGRRRIRRRWYVGFCVLVVGFSMWGATAQAALVHPYLSQLTGRESEPFSKLLCGVNVDPATGEVYVADSGAEVNEEAKPAIDVFSAASAFIGMIDKGVGPEWQFREACSTAVNDTTHNIYVANAGEGEGTEEAEKEAVFVYAPKEGELGKYKFEKKLKIDGSETPAKSFMGNSSGELRAGGPLRVAIAQGVSPTIYVAVAEQEVIDVFDSNGKYLSQLTFPTGSTPGALATDASGNLYAAVAVSEAGQAAEVIDEFSPTGVLLEQINGSTAGGFGQLSGLAVDSSGHIYASDGEKRLVDEFDSTGGFMGQITGTESPAGSFATPAGVAVNAAGDVYVADHTAELKGVSGVVDVFAPATPGAPPFIESESVTGLTSTSATLEAQIDPTGVHTTYHFEFAPEGGSFTKLPEVDIGSGESIQGVETKLQGLAPGTKYVFRVVVDGGTEQGSLTTFTTLPEGVVSGLPDGRAWELVSPSNKHGALIKGIGSDGVVQAAADGTRITYSATNPTESNPQANAGDAPLLSLRGSGAWSSREIIPPDYPPATIEGLGTRGLENKLFSTDLSSTLLVPFQEEPLLSPEASERTPYVHNLNDVACRITETTCYLPLVTGKGEFANVPLTEPPIKFGGPKTGAASVFGSVRLAGATPDLSHVVLQSAVPLKTEFNTKPLTGKDTLYEWTASTPGETQGEREAHLQLVSVLPNGEAASELEAARLGAFKNDQVNVRHAISDNGSRIAWETVETGFKHLYLRDTEKGETVLLDSVQGGTGEGPHFPVFQTASADGSIVFFTDEQQLTSDSTASEGKPDLYACRVEPAEGVNGPLGCTLNDLTGKGIVKNVGESAFVQGLLPGATEEGEEGGTDVFFVADGVLSSAENAHHEKATPGSCGEFPPPGATCNLYLEHYNVQTKAWGEPTFIAALSADDGPDWGALATGGSRLQQGAPVLSRLTSRVSPNGKQLAFMSNRPLTGFDNTDASKSAGGAADEEVFLYTANSNQVVCASCNRFGQKPHGVLDTARNDKGVGQLVVDRQNTWTGRWLAASIPGWTNASEPARYQSRYLSNSGRLFFNSSDALVPTDTNLTEDVYEYEPNGVPVGQPGECTSSSGCMALISSGKSQEESAFLDASENGGDVFFLTTVPLTSDDTDQSFDVYDAHVCTSELPCRVPATTAQQCASSTSCQGPSSQQTGFGSPASSTLSGSGNIVQSGVLPNKVVKLTKKQQLEKALKACKKLKRTKRRAACERSARKKFGAKKARKSAKRASNRRGAGGKR